MALLVAAAQCGVVEWRDVARITGLPFDDLQRKASFSGLSCSTTILNSACGSRSCPASLTGVTGDKRNPVRAAPTSSLTAYITSSSKRARLAMEPP